MRGRTMSLEWSEPRGPCAEYRYDHIVAKTPLGDIELSWKSWKNYDAPCGLMPWGEFVDGHDLDTAKKNAQASWDHMVQQLIDLMSPPF
jgi:hypothetical protein